MNTDDPRLEDVISAFMEAGLARIHTSIPAVVVTYDPVTQRATVQPVIRARVVDQVTGFERPTLAPPPPIPNLPVVWPSGGAGVWSFTGPLVPGDPVTLVVAERSTDEWRTGGAPDNAALDARRWHLADAVVLPGGRTLSPQPATGPLPATAVGVGPVLAGTPATPVALGSSLAVDAALKGTLFEVDMSAFLTAFNVFITACSTATTAAQIAAAAATFLPSAVTFASTVSSGVHQSTIVKVSP